MTLPTIDEAVGVIVARFQVPKLHAGHRYTIDFVRERHQDVLIILGVAPALTDRNPLSFEMRKGMLEAAYPDHRLTIVGSDSLPSSYEERSRRIDDLIRQSFPGRKAVVYGARDSFLETYCGAFPKYMVQTVYSGSATDVRKAIVPINSADFRAGAIYAAMNRKPFSHPAIDVVIIGDGPKGKRIILVGKRDEEDKLRFPGVFFNPDLDQSYEDAAQRCIAKEVPRVRTSEPRIIASRKIDDWRYHKTKEGVITLFLSAKHLGGEPVPGQGVDTVRWVELNNIESVLIGSHLPLVALLKNVR
jgi:bifunctional NMN adenylyltransferase/nudix hydrolase